MLSTATVTSVLVPLIGFKPGLVLVVLVGTGIGSLIPDIDAEDAAVFHDDVKGLNTDIGTAVNNVVAPLLPFFGYSTKYIIYRPALMVYGKIIFRSYSFEDRHRSFTHSILGVFTMTFLTGLIMASILLYAGLLNTVYLLGFLSGYMTGAFLHMIQDSCTKTGIAWNSPFSDTKLKGDISTGKDFRKPRLLTHVFGAVVLLSVGINIGVFYTLSLLKSTVILAAANVLIWFIFMRFFADVRIE